MNYSDSLGFLLSVSFRMLKKRIDSVLSPYNLTAPQWGVLSRLYENDGLTLVEIASRLHSDPSTIKLIIDKLNGKGFIEKISNEKDKRSARVFLTEDAKLLETPLRTLIVSTIDSSLENFTSEEHQSLKFLLKKLIKNLTGEKNMNTIKNYKLELFAPPCFPGAKQWSGKITFDSVDLTELLPYINGFVKKRIYQPQLKTIVFNFENHKVSVRPKEIKIGNIIDKDDANTVAKKVIDFINEIALKKEEITPDFKKKEPPKVIDIFKILPKTNCKKCNYTSCFVFATKLSQGEAEIYECAELDNEKKEELQKLFWQQ